MVVLAAIGCVFVVAGMALVYWKAAPIIAGLALLKWLTIVAAEARRQRDSDEKKKAQAAAIEQRRIAAETAAKARPAACTPRTPAPERGASPV